MQDTCAAILRQRDRIEILFRKIFLLAKGEIDGKSQFTSLKFSFFCVRTIILHRKLTKIER